MTLGIFGLFLGFVVMILMVCKGCHLSYSAIVCVLIIIVFNGVDIREGMSIYWASVGESASLMWAMWFFSAIFAKLCTTSGAAAVIAEGIMKIVDKCARSERGRRHLTIAISLIICIVITYGGINVIPAMLLMAPIYASAFEKVNIPRRFIPSIVMGGVSIAICGPGCPQLMNSVPCELAGVSPTAGLIPGIIGMIAIFLVSFFFLRFSVNRDLSQGKIFEWGKLTRADNSARKPSFLVSIIPLIVVFASFNFLKIELGYAFALGCVVCLILFWTYFPRKEGQNRYRAALSSIGLGVTASTVAILALPSFGIGAVVQACPSYDILCNALVSIPGPAIIGCTVLLIVSVMICCQPVAGMRFAIPIAIQNFATRGVPLAAIARIGAFSTQVLDSLPIGAGIPVFMEMVDVPFGEGYKPAFMTTVVATFCGTCVVMLLYMLFPALP